MNEVLLFFLLLLGISNSVVWLGISLLILYNLYVYTVDKKKLRDTVPNYLRKYFPGL